MDIVHINSRMGSTRLLIKLNIRIIYVREKIEETGVHVYGTFIILLNGVQLGAEHPLRS